MNKEELVERVAEQTGATKKDVATILNAALDLMAAELRRGAKVTLVGFGTFTVRTRRAREGRNPQTGARIHIPARNVPAFTPGKDLKARVNG
ncbi:MAG: HU family DNA-binding protein [Armatimonadota bacterium]|nr:HU family DNA-binding protein [Armatimonadota bacterium]